MESHSLKPLAKYSIRTRVKHWANFGEKAEAWISILDDASVIEARNNVMKLGTQVGLSPQQIAEVLIVVSELAHNQIQHALSGEIIIRKIHHLETKGIEIVAIDHGPGIRNPESALSGNVPADSKSLKGGLAAVYRLSDETHIDNRWGEGTCILARKFITPPSRSCEIAIMGRPFPGELRSGDDGVFFWKDGKLVIGIADGFGHGEEARKSSEIAIECLQGLATHGFSATLDHINENLTHRRGVMLDLGTLHISEQLYESICIGDVSEVLYHGKEVKHSHCHYAHLLGETQAIRLKFAPQRITVSPGDLIVLFTDGIQFHVTEFLKDFSLRRKPAIFIAQRILENFSRNTDDALVLVVRIASKGHLGQTHWP